MSTTIEGFVGLHGQTNEIFRRVGNGTLDQLAVKRALQDIIEGKFPTMAWNPPAWWRTPEQQMERARQLWPGIPLPEPPTNFVPKSPTGVLLLHVPQPFDELWSLVVAPEGYTTWRWDDLKSGKKHLRLAPNALQYDGPTWIEFDPEHGKGIAPNKFWEQNDVYLAASEVLSAVIQFRDWPLTWFKNGASAPNLAGYQFFYSGNWSGVPCVLRWDDGRRLKLYARFADDASNGWSSPSVRKCC